MSVSNDRRREEIVFEMTESMNSIGPQKMKSLFGKYMNKHLQEYGITESQVQFILGLDDKVGVSLKKITDDLKVHKSLTSRMMYILIKEGFVINEAKALKEYSVILTEKGMEVKKKTCEIFHELTKMFISDFSDDELETFNTLLKRMTQSMIRTLENDG